MTRGHSRLGWRWTKGTEDKDGGSGENVLSISPQKVKGGEEREKLNIPKETARGQDS